jgi:3-hydroxybutyryl-CoA dehydrogenase
MKLISSVRSVAVIGAGTMGQGIAQVFAAGGYDTLLFDTDPALPLSAKAKIDSTLNTQVAKGKLDEETRSSILNRIRVVRKLEEVVADFIIEAVVEDLAIKQNLFQELEKQNSSNTIFCTNTSSLSVTKIFRLCLNQERCLGVHFFNPAPIMKLVELISGELTSPVVTTAVADLLRHMGKIPVASKDSPGFIVNRVARHYYLESLKILEERGSTVEDIDALMMSVGFKMGPFELMDLIGIDVNLAVTTAVYNGFGQNPKYKPSAIQTEKVSSGRLGRKSGKGFYEY